MGSMKLHLPLALPLVLLGCSTTGTSSVAEADGGDAGAPEAEVVDARGEFDSTWDYLAEKYDDDGDGVIQPEEFDRDDAAFSGHDRNADGVISFADYDPDGRKARQEARRQSSYAYAATALYFQTDGNPDSLDAAELEAAFAVYDRDGDGRVEAAELAAAAEAQRAHGLEPTGNTARRLEDGEPFETLSVAIDKDTDGALSRAEVVAFFDRHAEHGAWALGSERREGARPSAPEVGQAAPDFTLRELGGPDGKGTVTLSSFAGDRPVALIFGSYT